MTDGPGGLDRAGQATSRSRRSADGSTLVAWVALSPGGDRLAVVRADALGDALRVEIHAAAIGWGEVAGWALPAGADRAVVAWAP